MIASLECFRVFFVYMVIPKNDIKGKRNVEEKLGRKKGKSKCCESIFWGFEVW